MMTIGELDTFRAETMRALLNPKGQESIWLYDVCPLRSALQEAIDGDNFDNMQTDHAALKAGHQYALIGPGIEDHPFTTQAELLSILRWLCVDGGYLSCYAAAHPGAVTVRL